MIKFDTAAKGLIGLIASASVSMVVETVIKSSVPTSPKMLNNIARDIGKWVIAGMVSDKATDWTMSQFEGLFKRKPKPKIVSINDPGVDDPGVDDEFYFL
jgi:hypothetical protein